MSEAARLLREARARAHLSQAELALRAGTSQPTVSAYERGRKDPSVATLARLLAVAGTTLTGEPGPVTIRQHLRAAGGLAERLRPGDLATAAVRIHDGEDVWFALREFLDGVNLCAEVEGRHAVEALITAMPAPAADARVNALLGAVAEHVAATHGVRRRPWVIAPDRFLDVWWFPHRRRAFDALALRDAPAAFRRRGIFLHPSMLERV